MTKINKSTLLLILTAILCLAAMIGILFIVAPSRPVRADEETKTAIELEEKEETGYIPNPDNEMKGGAVKENVEEKQKDEIIIDEKEWTINGEPIYNRPDMFDKETKDYAPYYHTIGIYEGYEVELRAYQVYSDAIYEYCDVFDYFINNNVLDWNGSEPSSCSCNELASFTCSECGHTPVIVLSGEHNFDGNPVIVSGFTVEHCSDCGKNICTDFYKSNNPVGNWESAFPALSEISKVVCLFKRMGTNVGTNVRITLKNVSGSIGAIDWGDGTISNENFHVYSSLLSEGRVCSIYGMSLIPDEMLADNLYLTSITIPDIVFSIGRKVFNGCNYLEKIIIDSETPASIQTNTFDGCSALIFVPDNCVNAYKAAWPTYANRIHGLSEQDFEPTPSEESGNNNPFDIGDWAQNTSNNISDWLGQNLGIATTGSTVLIIGIAIIAIMIFKRRR